MATSTLPEGRFTYGPRAAVKLDVEYIEGKTKFIPIDDPIELFMDRTDRLLLRTVAVNELASRAGATPFVTAHYVVAFFAAKLAVGRAIPDYNAALLDAPTVWERVNGDLTDEELAKRRRNRDILAIEMVRIMVRWHPGRLDPSGLKAVRYSMLTTRGYELDSPLQKGLHSRIKGELGVAVAQALRESVRPWFRENIAA